MYFMNFIGYYISINCKLVSMVSNMLDEELQRKRERGKERK